MQAYLFWGKGWWVGACGLVVFFRGEVDYGIWGGMDIPEVLECRFEVFWNGVLVTCSSPRRTFFLHALSFECTSKLCITFLNQFSVYFHI